MLGGAGVFEDNDDMRPKLVDALSKGGGPKFPRGIMAGAELGKGSSKLQEEP